MINQVSVFIQNSSGRLAAAAQFLADANIDIRALSLADTTDFGILRMIVNDTDKAVKVLKENNRIVNITPVLRVKLPDKPGSLALITKLLSDNEIDIQYMYAFVSASNDGAYMVIKVENPDAAVELLNKNNIALLEEKDIQNI